MVQPSGKEINERKPTKTLSYISPGRTRFLLDDDNDMYDCSKPDEHITSGIVID